LFFVVLLQLFLQPINLLLLLSVPFFQGCHFLPGLGEILLGDVVGEFSLQIDSIDVLFLALPAQIFRFLFRDGYLVSFQ
jgi:hypothetical protein